MSWLRITNENPVYKTLSFKLGHSVSTLFVNKFTTSFTKSDTNVKLFHCPT